MRMVTVTGSKAKKINAELGIPLEYDDKGNPYLRVSKEEVEIVCYDRKACYADKD